ncbi:MAG: DUF1501 domain-containing protein [Planctomyces sp.]|nr:DUF1501 domain-containing protein [Planctomyces sp.]
MISPRYLLNRRRCLQIGGAGVVGSCLPSALQGAMPLSGSTGFSGNGGTPRAKSVILVLLSGGPSQLDTLDPKPDAPAEVRGEFKSIQTTIAGAGVCEHLPRLARMTNEWSIVRTLAHVEHNHLLATHVALTGRPTPLPRGGSDLDRVESRNDFPNVAAALDFVKPRTDGIPSGVSLPNYLIEGPLTWPGQHAGFLGTRHDPWQINHDPNEPTFKVDSLSLPGDMTGNRLVSRRELLNHLNDSDPVLGKDTRAKAFVEQQDVAFSLLTSARVANAFRIDTETDQTRSRYGRNKFGQSLLLSRRLAEAGVPIIQATMGIVQTWDTHVDNWGRLKNVLLPQLDQGLEALITDLSASGLLQDTMVIVMGEFGRTPRVSTLPGQTVPGRDHWAHAYSALFAGGGVRGGQVLGQTDAIAAYPVSRSWSPADVCTTLFSALGVHPEASVDDPLGRKNYLMNGDVIEPLFTGAEATESQVTLR